MSPNDGLKPSFGCTLCSWASLSWFTALYNVINNVSNNINKNIHICNPTQCPNEGSKSVVWTFFMPLGRGGLVLELVVVAVQYFQSLAGRVIKLSTTKKKEKKILHRA